MRAAFVTGALCFLLSTYAVSQTSNATVGGTVSDSTGASIPGVSITATNVATGIVTNVVSNEAGAYQFASLQTGTYTLKAELPGFQTQTYNNVVLGGSQQVRLNFALQVGSVATTVEVTAAADTLIATTSASVGTVLPDYKVRDLPLAGRNVLDLVLTTPGSGPTSSGGNLEGYFAGSRLSAVNTTRDGFVVSDGRYDFGAFSNTYTSPDLVEEVRVVTSTVDAEAGRGSGQVSMVTRSGTNQFRGSAFLSNSNSALYASNWFNNFNSVPKDYQNRNQYGARLGGPIIKNKAFFFVLLDQQRSVFKRTFVGTVLTPLARQGIFRYFPSSDNQNVVQANPVVDRNGNAVDPTGQGRQPSSFSVFNRDPNRPGFDPSGIMENIYLARMPLPNDYTVGDGLNTAGIRFTRYDCKSSAQCSSQTFDENRNQFNTRFDYNFSSKHKLSVVYTYEKDYGTASGGIMQWPGGYSGIDDRLPRLFTVSFVSTMANLVNEARVGYKISTNGNRGAWSVGRNVDDESGLTAKAKEIKALLPVRNGIPVIVTPTLFPDNFLSYGNNLDGQIRNQRSPFYTYADTISWNQGKHSYKAGAEVRFGHSDSWNDSWFEAQAILGAGGPAVQGIDNIALPGLTGNNQTTARNLLTDLSGSVAQLQQAFDIRDVNNPVFLGYSDGVKSRIRDPHANEFGAFFKDTWKVTPSVTLNLGIHYDWYGVPYDGTGAAGRAVGAEKGLCGITCGAITAVEFVGKHSPHPDRQLYDDDYNNFAPSVGMSWSLPWWGNDKTVLRVGYGWNYVTNTLKGVPGGISSVAGALPGTFGGSTTGTAKGLFYTQAGYVNLASFTLPIPKIQPLLPDPLEGQRSNNFNMYASNRPNPYVQNFNFGLQREILPNLTLDVAYVGSKGTRLYGGIEQDYVEIFKNNFLEAFNVTRAGNNAPLFDTMLNGLNIPGAGVVNGTTVTGSAALRTYTSTRAFIANGNVGQLADFLNTSTAITGKGGGFYRGGGFPENFFTTNPQFKSAVLHGTPGNSTYHSLQVQVTKRLSKGFTNSTAYTWSRGLGDNDGDGAVQYRDPNNRRLNKALLSYHRTHQFTSNGTYELPFGSGRPLLANAPGWVQRIVERWQLGGILNLSSGTPFNVTASVSTMTQNASVSTPNIVGKFSKDIGKVTRLSNGVSYFTGIQQIDDPARSSVTTANGLQGTFSNKAIVDAQGNLLLVNPAPGTVGNLGLRYLEGPGAIRLDVDLIKRVMITETKEFELRVDAVNVLNHPNFGTPTADINSASFGRITTATGERSFVINGRLNF